MQADPRIKPDVRCEDLGLIWMESASLLRLAFPDVVAATRDHP